MSQLRVVLDTNVVLSSLLFRSGRLSQLRHGWQGKRFLPVVCSQTMAELVRVVGYKNSKSVNRM
jgi:predicted nucleic acid-binding protein